MDKLKTILSKKRNKIIATIICIFILDLIMSVGDVLSEKRMYNSDNDEFYFKLKVLFFWMFGNLGTIFIIAFLILIFLVIIKLVAKFIKWAIS